MSALLKPGTICTTIGANDKDAERLVVVLNFVGAFPHAGVVEGYWIGTLDKLPFASIQVYRAADGTFKLETKPLSNACIVDRKLLRPLVAVNEKVGDSAEVLAELDSAVLHRAAMSGLLSPGTICTVTGGTDDGRLVEVLRLVVAHQHDISEGYWIGTRDRLPFAATISYNSADVTFQVVTKANARVVDRKNLRPMVVADGKVIDLDEVLAEREGAVIH